MKRYWLVFTLDEAFGEFRIAYDSYDEGSLAAERADEMGNLLAKRLNATFLYKEDRSSD